MTPNTLSRLGAIKRFFELDGGRKLIMEEVRALSDEEKTELGSLAAAELGVTLQEVSDSGKR